MPTPEQRIDRTGAAHADPGSFRDPLSRVFIGANATWRGLSATGLDDYHALAASSFFATALERGDIVGTELVRHPPDVPGNWVGVLRHDPIAVWSYPFEWSFEMLRDAARLQLDLTQQALAEGLITKDASPYNVLVRRC